MALLFIKSKSQFSFGKNGTQHSLVACLFLGTAGDPAALEGPSERKLFFREHLQEPHNWVRFTSVWVRQGAEPPRTVSWRPDGSQWKGVSYTTGFTFGVFSHYTAKLRKNTFKTNPITQSKPVVLQQNACLTSHFWTHLFPD